VLNTWVEVRVEGRLLASADHPVALNFPEGVSEGVGAAGW